MGPNKPCKFGPDRVCVCGKKRGPDPRTVVLKELADAMEGGYVPEEPLTYDEARAIAAIRRTTGSGLLR